MPRKPRTSYGSNGSYLPGRERPDWRWMAAAPTSDDSTPGHTDAIVRRVARYRHALLDDVHQARVLDPVLADVDAIQADQWQSETLKLLVIAGTPPTEILAYMDVVPTVLELWERVHYDVRSRLSAPGWVYHFIISAELETGGQKLAERLGIAYAGGPTIAKLLLDEQRGFAVATEDEVVMLRMRMQAKLRQTLKVPLRTPTQATKVVSASVAIERLSVEYDLARMRHQAQVEQAQRLHEENMIRLQTAYLQSAMQAKSAGLDVDRLLAPVPAPGSTFAGTASAPHDSKAGATVHHQPDPSSPTNETSSPEATLQSMSWTKEADNSAAATTTAAAEPLVMANSKVGPTSDAVDVELRRSA